MSLAPEEKRLFVKRFFFAFDFPIRKYERYITFSAKRKFKNFRQKFKILSCLTAKIWCGKGLQLNRDVDAFTAWFSTTPNPTVFALFWPGSNTVCRDVKDLPQIIGVFTNNILCLHRKNWDYFSKSEIMILRI